MFWDQHRLSFTLSTDFGDPATNLKKYSVYLLILRKP